MILALYYLAYVAYWLFPVAPPVTFVLPHSLAFLIYGITRMLAMKKTADGLEQAFEEQQPIWQNRVQNLGTDFQHLAPRPLKPLGWFVRKLAGNYIPKNLRRHHVEFKEAKREHARFTFVFIASLFAFLLMGTSCFLLWASVHGGL